MLNKTYDVVSMPRTRDDILKLAAEIGIIKQENFSPEQKRRVVVRRIKSILIRRTAGAVCRK